MKRIALLISLGFSFSSYSQQKDTVDLTPVEVKAIRANSIAPFAKTNISKKEIEKQNLGQDLPFLLNQTPSVVVNSDAGNGVGYTYIHIRGTDASRINVTLNGIPYNDAESQGTFFVDLPDVASSVSGIQIQRGVGTSTNGSGSFGATINFSTNEVNKSAYAEVNNCYGSYYTLKNTIKAGTGLLGNHFTADFRVSRISSSGYMDRATSDLKSVYFTTAYLSDKTEIRFNILSGKEKTYQAWYGVSEEDLPFHRTINYAGMEKPGSPYNNETDNYWQNHYQLFYTQKFTPRLSFNTGLFYTKGYGYYEEYRANQNYADYNMPYPIVGSDTLLTTDLIRQLWLDNDFYGSIFSLQQQSKNTSLIFGGAITRYTGSHFGKIIWSQNELTGPSEWYRVNAAKNDMNYYGKWQQKMLKNIQLFADIQYRRVNYNLNGFELNKDLILNPIYNFINPKVGLSFYLNKLMVYGSYSISNKEPNRDDFEASQQQQPKPEHLEDLEAGIEDKGNKESWAVNLYYMKYKDQLVLTGKINDVGAYTRNNIPDSYRLGVELQGSVTILPFLKASGNFTLSKNKILNYTEYLDDYDNGGQKTNFYKETDISFSPNIIASAILSLTPLKNLNFDLLSKYVGKQYLDNSSNNSRKLNPFFTEDLRAIFGLHKGWLKNTNIIVQIYNLFNKKYEPNGYTYSYYENNSLVTQNYYFPMAGINWMAGVNIKL
jgi:iron complex outermembrane receptor protein